MTGRPLGPGGCRTPLSSLFSAFPAVPTSVLVVLIYEYWETEPHMLAFRGGGPSDDQQTAIVDADVKRFDISSVGAP